MMLNIDLCVQISRFTPIHLYRVPKAPALGEGCSTGSICLPRGVSGQLDPGGDNLLQGEIPSGVVDSLDIE